MKKYLFIVAVVCISVISSSCWLGKYRPPKLETIKKPDPMEDYVRLKALFKKYNGKLTADDDTVVKWKDSWYYRIFEFKHHTVAIFPYNWNENCFDLYIFAGHLKKYDDLLNDIYFTRYAEGDKLPYYTNETMSLNPGFDKNIGFEGMILGTPKNTVFKWGEKELYNAFKKQGESDSEAKRRTEIFSVHGWPKFNEYLNSNTCNFDFIFEFTKDKLVWMEFITSGTPMIAHYNLGSRGQKFGVLAEGEFKIPIEKKVESKTENKN